MKPLIQGPEQTDISLYFPHYSWNTSKGNSSAISCLGHFEIFHFPAEVFCHPTLKAYCPSCTHPVYSDFAPISVLHCGVAVNVGYGTGEEGSTGELKDGRQERRNTWRGTKRMSQETVPHWVGTQGSSSPGAQSTFVPPWGSSCPRLSQLIFQAHI